MERNRAVQNVENIRCKKQKKELQQNTRRAL